FRSWLTAPLFSRLVHLDERIFSGLLYLIVGGDVVSPDAANRLYQSTPEVVLINGYGPTENTTFSTFHVVPRKSTGAIPIGRALSNSSAYVMDESRPHLPAFGEGYIYVCGSGVAQRHFIDS